MRNLDDLARASEGATRNALRVDATWEEYLARRDEWSRCLQFPDPFDVSAVGCEGTRSDAESAREVFRVAVHKLERGLGVVKSDIGSVEVACGVEL